MKTNKQGEEMIKYAQIMTVILMLTFIALPASGEEKILQIRGSDTIVNLVQKMVEVYLQKNPGKNMAVTGGGSGNGLAGLRNRTVDIADSSREIKQKEIIDMKGMGVNPVGIVIAKDCITIVVNENNKVSSLTIEQLGSIYRGEAANWKDVGGADMAITLYGRQSNSGTFEVFRKDVLGGEYSDNMKRMNGNSQIVESVASDESGIGFVGIGYAQNNPRLKVISIARKSGEEYVDPNNRGDVDSGKYPLVRPLYQYTDGVPSGAIRDFIEFELSPEGQKIVDDMGFIPVSKDYEEENRRIAGI